ncbi:MAG: cytochrome c3 family protein [Acidobacteriota bacterium]|nr:cytochrome c3 family protein [Acidobacteriota bacterium]
MWNHQTSTAGYSTYTSTTLDASTPIGNPDGSSKLCLSCHDGTVALGQTVNNGLIALSGAGAGGKMPAGNSNLGVDLTDDHPVSFQRSGASTDVTDPPGGDAVELDSAGKIQCTACHDAHSEDNDPVTRKFLVKQNRASALCLTCHQPDYWSTNPSAHQSSAASYTSLDGAHTGYSTVADNGCESCHRPHSGNEPQRLLKEVEEQTCAACHDGSVAAVDIVSEFSKAASHPTFSTTPSVHDASEEPNDPSYPLPEISPGASRHAECQDCHNPHASFDQAASTPGGVTGALSGVWGIDSAGAKVDPAQYEYEICYKCHADSANKPQESGLPNPPYSARQIVQFNVRLEFDPGNPSHHAVEAAGANADVPSLLPGWTTSSILRCTDCHNNESGPGAGGGGPNGPHGSIYHPILERRLDRGINNTGTNFDAMYAMCFKCHDRASIMGDNSFKEHRKHIDGENTSCLVCHDPHGVSATQGNATNNSHLINFDTDYVTPSSSGILRFEDQGTFKGRCYLTCHGKNHNPKGY